MGIREGCNFETMRWGNLKRHYMKIHGYAENELPEENKIVYKELELKEDSKPAAKPKVTKSTRPEKVSEKVSTEKVGKSKKKSTQTLRLTVKKGKHQMQTLETRTLNLSTMKHWRRKTTMK